VSWFVITTRSFVRADDSHDDLAWSYDFPPPRLLPIPGLVAFYNEFVDVVVGRKAGTAARRSHATRSYDSAWMIARKAALINRE
jgi:hypothetical protein